MNPTNNEGCFTLEYTKEAYRQYYAEKFITDYNHGPLTKGDIDPVDAKNMIALLNNRAKVSVTGVFFDEIRLENEVEGGSCSAIALKVAKLAVDLFNSLDVEAEDFCDQYLAKITDAVKSLNREGIKKSGPGKRFRKEIRSLQGAYNTICVDKSQKVDDIAQEKIKAIGSYYNLTVKQSTDQLNVKSNDNFEEDLNRQLQSLSDGVYLIRILQLEDNHKLETKGHSVVYVKHQKGLETYFDTQLGLYDLTIADNGNKEKKHLIYHSLRSADMRFGVDCLKFHKLDKGDF